MEKLSKFWIVPFRIVVKTQYPALCSVARLATEVKKVCVPTTCETTV